MFLSPLSPDLDFGGSQYCGGAPCFCGDLSFVLSLVFLGVQPSLSGTVVHTHSPGSVSSELSASAASPHPPDFMLFPWSLFIQ